METQSNSLIKHRCTGEYSFIENKPLNHLTYEDAWKDFKQALSSTCKPIKRYPVVARWRNDVDFTAAGIYCFQPHCVTGEVEPPANPLICPQFCVRFNDLDNIGVTGRHYSGFIMLGIQAFNSSNRIALSPEDCTELNYAWVKDALKVDPTEITFIEDVWAGGGNLGPSIEYFVGGLEIGNMVFMKYKVDDNNELIDLPIKVIDVGIGLERIPWLINGGATSYKSTFGPAYDYLKDKLQIKENKTLLEQFAKYSCRLNVDEEDDISKQWEEIASKMNMKQEEVKGCISPTKDMCICLDHTRTLLMAIEDGLLPSNLSGGGNLRSALRRVFSILHQNKWWELIKLEGLKELLDLHREQLTKIYGEFNENSSINKIVETEYGRWLSTEEQHKKQMVKLLKKGKLTVADWTLAVSSWGMSPEKITQATNQTPPANLYQLISETKNDKKTLKQPLNISKNYPETKILYYKDLNTFKGTVLDTIQVKDKVYIILDETAFYPLSGGQDSDIGYIEVNNEKYNIIECLKSGRHIYHALEKSPSSNLTVRVWVEVVGNGSERCGGYGEA